MQLSSYRKNAKPQKKEKELLFKKPWWQFWERKAKYFHSTDKRNYVWVYIKKWSFPSEVPPCKDILYYTTEGRWVVQINTKKQTGSSGTWNWFLHGDSLAEIEKELEDDSWAPDKEECEVAKSVFDDLIAYKDGTIGKNREIRI